MNASEVETFLHLLGCRKIKRGSSWVNATCPFGYYHRKGKDSVPSFGISIKDGGESRCRCQACGVYGPLLPLVWALAPSTADPKRAFDFLVTNNMWHYLDDDDGEGPAPENSDLMGRVDHALDRYVHRKAPVLEPEVKKQSEVPEPILVKMQAYLDYDPEVLDFLTLKRKIKLLTAKEWELGWAPDERRLCVPIRDGSGKLVSISGRLLVRDIEGNWTDDLPEDSPPKYLHSPFSRNVVLYGMDKVISNRVGYLFEGFFQAIFSYQCGYNNVLGRMGTHLSGAQKDYLAEHFDKLVLVPDGDEAGYKSVEKIEKELQAELGGVKEIVVAPMPEGFDADQLTEDHLRQVLGPPNR